MIRQRVQFQRLIALLKNHIAQKVDFNTHFKPYPKKIFKITVRKCPLTVAQQEQRGCQGEAPSPPPGYFLPHTLQRLDCLWGRSCVWCAGTPDSSARPHFPLGVWHWRAETWEELLCPCGAGVQLLQGEAGCQPAVHPRQPVHQLLPGCEEHCPLVLCPGEINLALFVPVPQLVFSAAAKNAPANSGWPTTKETSVLRCSLGCGEVPRTSLWAAGMEGPTCKHSGWTMLWLRWNSSGTRPVRPSQDSSHLQCLKLLATALVHKDFSIYSIKSCTFWTPHQCHVGTGGISWSWSSCACARKRNTLRILLWATGGFCRRSVCSQM